MVSEMEYFVGASSTESVSGPPNPLRTQKTTGIYVRDEDVHESAIDAPGVVRRRSLRNRGHGWKRISENVYR